ncbi:MAG: BREX system Lon protease-like protein BrxL [Caldilineaceae bacterium]|nr:BREX system Lon protease-like protein BrxL [Caldilineaceae bacterium]HRK69138.1 BREX system Lon protease-like protein BrxL [Hyphomonas sp.]
MNPLDTKITHHFPGLVVRKDLVKVVKGNAIVPSYVLEYLLGQYCATADEASIQSGIETVREVLARHFVHRSEAGLVRSTIRERGRHKVIDKVSVDLNEKRDAYEATFSNLGIKQVLVDADTIKRHPKLLVGGVWCIADVSYEYTEERNAVPWILDTVKPIQLSSFDFEGYLAARRAFTTDEWIDLLVQSIGFNPEFFSRRAKLMQLVRLIPYCERNYNLIELGPKGTGKSHIYSEFSPHGILISGGEVSVAKLFVNNANGRIGLVGYWDVVAFDEFAGKKKRADKALVDILKNYMANKSFSRGIETLGAEASMAFVGNTQHTLPYMLRHTDLFDDLPEQYHDSAFLDRLHFYIPGWEVDIIRGEMFSTGYGFVVDYLAEILRNLRNQDYSHLYRDHFELSSDLSDRDRTGVQKTFAGLMKILYPHREATAGEIEELLKFALEGRRRVKDQLMRIDPTYAEVHFGYQDRGGEWRVVRTLEEELYPRYYIGSASSTEDMAAGVDQPELQAIAAPAPIAVDDGPREGHLTFREHQRGVTYDQLFGPYLRHAQRIVVTDPYIRLFFQARNFMELLETVARQKAEDEEIAVHLMTIEDEFKGDQQRGYLEQMQTAAAAIGIQLTWDFDTANTIHARHIVTDHGWKILLDRGLDIYQHYEMNDAFAFTNRLQQYRACKAFEVTYLKIT